MLRRIRDSDKRKGFNTSGGSIATSDPSCIESYTARPIVYDLHPAFGNLLPESHFQKCFEDTSTFIVFFFFGVKSVNPWTLGRVCVYD
jgi:hypothetical protein